MVDWITALSKWLLPIILAFVPVYALAKKVPIYESFTEGAKEGIPTVIQIIPHLVGMMVAVAVFRESGALQFYLSLLYPLTSLINFPQEVLPLGLLRPISGAGALAFMESIFQQQGPDSFLGMLASTMQGSTDTTLYVLTVYFGAVGIRRSMYAVKVGFMADFAGLVASWIIVTMMMGG
ncbi:spore maturation protein [Mechercharimyces sp. CAU 1602]|uniref:spore maturation protein n=1 Tax=Mechercharimyces sp. CAU 1602 TaxID=2973933 RepID=UPI0021616204|nr:nucleoside recognition domain-containing protein [Mechercharimyces sp. CAU 1602]MCS1350918.1 spore maturation protein [Mechercharimyces sp. CAU 1602]